MAHSCIFSQNLRLNESENEKTHDLGRNDFAVLVLDSCGDSHSSVGVEIVPGTPYYELTEQSNVWRVTLEKSRSRKVYLGFLRSG